MNKTVREWIAKAEGDFSSATRESRARRNPNYDAACFHAQQCIEKLMKALLIQGGKTFLKTHDLVILSEAVAGRGVVCIASVAELRFLTRAAVAFRYPGEAATRTDARQAYRICVRLRDHLLDLLRKGGRQKRR
jgi:HEPN domain-containing protein